jgi:hypothetical protein
VSQTTNFNFFCRLNISEERREREREGGKDKWWERERRREREKDTILSLTSFLSLPALLSVSFFGGG